MKPQLINGTEVSNHTQIKLQTRVKALQQLGIRPGLCTIIIGDDPSSHIYVAAKIKMCDKLGIYSKKIVLAQSSSQAEVLAVIQKQNLANDIHGILVQSPPPPHIDEQALVRAIAPHKDVDGFHPENIAKLFLEDATGLVSCTPAGCLELLNYYNITTSGKKIVILGRSLIVGKPLALLLMNKHYNATVTVLHSRSKDIVQQCQQADIIFVAIGKANFLTAEMVTTGTTVIDVGINRITDATSPKGYRIVGDVDFATVAPKCHAITPVPGGVGPMTIQKLMENTVIIAEQSCHVESN